MTADLFQLNSISPRTKTDALLQVAESLLGLLVGKVSISPKTLQDHMTRAFGGTDASGNWQWKDAYEALEIAQIKFVQKYADTLRQMKPEMVLTLLQNLQNLCPTHTKRSDESVAMQQYSTPLPLALAVAQAANIQAGDVVLEPSAGTGMLAVLANLKTPQLILNELAIERGQILKRLFPKATLSAHNAEYLADTLDSAIKPTIVVMNPPFSSSPNAASTRSGVTMQHIVSALRLLPQGGRLVTITGESFSPYSSKYRASFVNLQKEATIRFSCGIDGKLYAKQGTTVATRLTVIDRLPAEDPESFANYHETADTAQALLDMIKSQVATRVNSPVITAVATPMIPVPKNTNLSMSSGGSAPETTKIAANSMPKTADETRIAIELEFLTRDWLGGGTSIGEGIYEAYEPQSIVIPDALPHPSALVQSAAMASIAGPKPGYIPHIYPEVVTSGILSAAQLESIIYAGEAHSQLLKGDFLIDDKTGLVKRVLTDTEGAVQFRRGWYLGDGTGCGKGRQVAGIMLDNWLKGRKRAIWVSKNDKLLEDARRDWVALGGKESDIIPQWQFKLGNPIGLSQGIIFTTYSTLRMPGKQDKCSRMEQLTAWLGKDFDGCLMFDEAHAMANALASKGTRGIKKPSAQGLAGIAIQNALPLARVVYVSATGATTVSNLAYAARLGLWGTDDIPFATQSEFIATMEDGGIAAMEVISRDLKALGLYTARSLSYEGVEYEFLEHNLTQEQIRIYDAYAEAFQVIHHNIEAALNATNINNNKGKARNGMAKAAVRSAFEGNKQRFFNHLIVAMKCPTLIKAIEADRENGHASVIQIVSTSEALMERRLAEIPTSEWNDLNIDITPREYVMDYLQHSFPVQLHEIITDDKGNETTHPAMDEDGNPIFSRVAVQMRDALIEKLCSLPAVPAALDQIIQHFGFDQVAEVTGRGRRIVRMQEQGRDRLCVQNRPASANLAETHAFMDDKKQILVFSDAGGTGRSYHADRGAKNKRLRKHYLLEAGWRADNAIQGLGRTNRTNQEQAPVFIPVASDVKGEKRFMSTIARRLDTLGAITKGQRETGGQGLFREEDNLESAYARAALIELYKAIYEGKVECCSFELFESSTGLDLKDSETGSLKQDLPPIHTFLNRVLALPIWLQNDLFSEFELRLCSRIEQAREAGLYEVGVETIVAEGFTVQERLTLYVQPESNAETICYKIERKDRTRILPLESALARTTNAEKGKLAKNTASGKVAVILPTNSLMSENGEVEERVQLLRPMSSSKMACTALADSGWQPINREEFSRLWQEEVKATPEFIYKSFYLITGILLPVWHKLPAKNVQVCRLQTDDGLKLLGRIVESHDITSVLERFNLTTSAPTLSPQEIVKVVTGQRTPYILQNGMELRSALIMGQQRIEVIGYREGQKDQLKAFGCISEIISWKQRIFIPANDNAPMVIEKLLQVA